ncbi:MAG: tripartite tricarboxylate transporter permease [Halobacteriales archaeon]|nr:tripartite tricarboxylate transporter permease [Halobacteriales archaeon]
MFVDALAWSPAVTATAFAFTLAGICLGTVSGLVPGLHANTMALVLAGIAPSLPGPPRYVVCAMLAAGVVHTFLDVVPTLALGVPDPAMAVGALPGHRLVIQGRGHETLRLSALGSGLAVVFAVPLAVPVTRVMVSAYPLVEQHLGVLLLGTAALLVVTESSGRAALAGVGCFCAATALGAATLDIDPQAPLASGSILMPLFTGLFGAPVLVDALSGDGVPEQGDATLAVSRRAAGFVAGVGTLAGAAVGYVPGVSSAVAATVALLGVPARLGARGFVVAVSAVNTANTVFALFALVALGSPRTGVLVAVDSLDAPISLGLWLPAIAIAACVGAILVPALGDRYLTVVGRLDYTRLSVATLAGLVVLTALLTGVVGVGVFAVATVLGLVPPRYGARRVHLMGVLTGPLALGL